MARLEKNSIEEAGVNPFNAPIPGEGMTNSPDNPKAWERPPEHSDEDTAMKELYLLLTEQDKLRELIRIIDEGIALDEIAQVVLYKGYTEGKYNPDLMLLLVEPTIYLLISIADYAEIKDYVLYEGEDNDPDTEIPDDNIIPVDVENDDIPTKDTNETFDIEKGEPDSSSIDSSLLARIKDELPAKVKAATMEEGEV
tara:strand:- start:2996 stop:3586 length:591 start_codon:yes stop_codon:yes gene_type:complete